MRWVGGLNAERNLSNMIVLLTARRTSRIVIKKTGEKTASRAIVVIRQI